LHFSFVYGILLDGVIFGLEMGMGNLTTTACMRICNASVPTYDGALFGLVWSDWHFWHWRLLSHSLNYTALFTDGHGALGHLGTRALIPPPYFSFVLGVLES
jgi:hypothetical protein